MKKRPSYLKAVVESLATMFRGMQLSGKHFVQGYQRDAPLGIADDNYFAKTQGPITIQYPMQKVPVPDNGRYRLFMETEDCIGCDKCARICPVDCITIETFRADGDLGRTSDGTMKRLHLPTFDIDMAKCMYCGLCTTVCPTECLVMTPVYDFSEYDRDNFVYHFGAYSPTEDSRIRLETEASLAAKKAAKAAESPSEPQGEQKPRPRPMARPVTAPALPVVETATPAAEETPAEVPSAEPPRPRPRPMMKRKEEATETTLPTEVLEKTDSPEPHVNEKSDSPEPLLAEKSESPELQSKEGSNAPESTVLEKTVALEPTPTVETAAPKPRPRPIMKPKLEAVEPPVAQDAPVPPSPEISPAEESSPEEPPKPKPRPRPIMRRPDDDKGGPAA